MIPQDIEEGNETCKHIFIGLNVEKIKPLNKIRKTKNQERFSACQFFGTLKIGEKLKFIEKYQCLKTIMK